MATQAFDGSRWIRCCGAALLVPLLARTTRAAEDEVIRFGIIGCDTSHVTAFTRLLNDAAADGHVPGGKVVAAFAGGSPDVESSANRIEGFTRALREDFGVEIVETIPALIERVDAVLLESVDGRPHLEQVTPVLRAGKPVFIDKPLAGSLADAQAILALARETGTPCFSSSSLRYYPGIRELLDPEAVGEIIGADAWSPCSYEPHHPDLFWYGVHGVEVLFTLMGPGCESVTRVTTADTDVVVGRWKDGRVGTFRGLRAGRRGYGATVFGAKKIATSGPGGGYEHLLAEIVRFVRSGKAPVPLEETVEMFAFMEAADESKRRGGAPVTLEAVRAAAAAAGD